MAIVGVVCASHAHASPQLTETATRMAHAAENTVSDAGAEFLTAIRRDPWTWLHVLGALASLGMLWMLRIIRPSALSASARDVGAHPASIWLLSAAMAFLAMIAGGAVTSSLFKIGGESNLRAMALMSLGNYAISLPMVFVLLRLLAMSAPRSGLELHSRDFVKGVIGLAFTWPLVQTTALGFSWIQVSAGGAPPNELAHPILELLRNHPREPWTWLLAGGAVIGAPLAEEFVFRGAFQSAVLRFFARPWIAILMSAAAFAAMHIGDGNPGNWHAIAALFVLGLGLGIAFEQTRSLTVPITMHMLFNLINILMTMIK
jgi:membrane protease YdiL (CAAX protease family)